MADIKLEEIKTKIQRSHKEDYQQLQVIFSEDNQIIVEAPAGFGKTTTMISRIAYLFASGNIPNPKHILVLTFSVNAALKVRREIAEKLPLLLNRQNNPIALEEKVVITNYHGLCKNILNKYGYLISDKLRKEINLFTAVDEDKTNTCNEISTILTKDEITQLKRMHEIIKNANFPDLQDVLSYNEIILNKLLPHDCVTYNAIILLVLEIFYRFPEVKKFYQSYFPLIVIDEFQDTNCIAWKLLESIIVPKQTQLLFLGDPLQRIYGFIGALPNIMNMATQNYNMTLITLQRNYRFTNNPEMLKLDKSIRRNAEELFAPKIFDTDIAHLPAFWNSSLQEEANEISTKIQKLIMNSKDRIAVLFRSRNRNSDALEKELDRNHVSYFYGLFMDSDPEYIAFHLKCKDYFEKQFGESKSVTYKTLQIFFQKVESSYTLPYDKTISSLLQLLKALIKRINTDYSLIQTEDKYYLLLEIFENGQIKQAMEYINEQVIISTIHGSKGLEWDYVFIVGLERWIFPSYQICKNCSNKFSEGKYCCCKLPDPLPEIMKKSILEELSLFYVGITRAKKQAFVSAISKKHKPDGREMSSIFSCFSNLNGIKLINANQW